MRGDAFALHAAACTDLGEASGADQRKTLRNHARRAVIFAQIGEGVGTPAGFLLQLPASGGQWVFALGLITDEVKLSSPFKREKLFIIMVKYIAPLCIVAILISSILEALGVIKY